MSKTKRKYKPSSGKRKVRYLQRRIKVLERKVKRFDRNRERGKKVSKNNSKMRRAKDWNISGLEKQIKFLMNML